VPAAVTTATGFPNKSRRTIKYLKQVVASREHAGEMDEFQKDHPPGAKQSFFGYMEDSL
jgi:hypothetical protein